MPRPRRQYGKPPLVEVFCEFVFSCEEDTIWDEFLVPAFYESIQAEYPRRSLHPSVGRPQQEGAAEETDAGQIESPALKYRFVSEDGNTSVRVGENLLLISQLPPYYGWERFEVRVKRVFEAYHQVWRPAKLERAVLHYLDHLDLPEKQAPISDYLNIYPSLPAEIDKPVAELGMYLRLEADREGDFLVVVLGQHASAAPDRLSLLIHWDYVSMTPPTPEVAAIEEWLRAGHDYIGKVFRSTITDKCERLFEPKDASHE